MSQAVSKLAVEKGIDLYLFNRGNNNQFAPPESKIIEGNIRDFSETKEKLKNYKFDVVIDFVAFTAEHVKNDIKLFKDQIEQYIFISSASAYQKPQTNYLIDESTPLANPYWEYSRNKIACEDVLINEYRKNAFPFTIVRPSHTYSKNYIPASINSSKSWTLVDRMRRGKKILVHGDGTSLWTMTHNSDFAKGIVGLIGNIKAIAHAFHITSDESLNWNQIYRSIARAAGVKIDIVHAASEKIAQYDNKYRGSLLGDKAVSVVFDNTKIKNFVPEFKAITSFAEGIQKTVGWFDNNPEYKEVDNEWNKLIDKIIKESV
jgi:nucleoside-diphosphate-sugar epimerase